MNAVNNIGRFLYAIPIAIFGLFHFMNASAMAGMVPIPGGAVWVYLTGLGLIAAAVSMFIGKYDKLGSMLLALMLVIFALSIHLPGAMGGDQSSVAQMLKDLALAGGALMYAKGLARDNSVIG